MKRLVLLALASLVVSGTFSNGYTKTIPQGTHMIGGASNSLFTKIDSDTAGDTTSVSFEIDYGYFFVENIQFLLSGYVSKDDEENGEITSVGFTAGGKFLLPIEEKTNFFIQGSFGILNMKLEPKNSEDYEADTDVLSIKTGIEYFFNDNVAIDLGLEYTKLDSIYKRSGYMDSPSFETKSYGAFIGFIRYFK